MRCAGLAVSLLSSLACDSTPQPGPAELVAESKSELQGPSVSEYLEVDALPPLEQVRGREISVHGWVAPGSIEQRAQPPSARFRVVRGQGSLVVEYTGTMPDNFREKLEVIVRGTLSDDGRTLRSESLVAKCPSNYDALPKWPAEGGPS